MAKDWPMSEDGHRPDFCLKWLTYANIQTLLEMQCPIMNFLAFPLTLELSRF